MIRRVFICDYEDYVRDAVTSAGTTSFDVGDGTMWTNITTISGLFGTHQYTISGISSNTITIIGGPGETIPVQTEVHSGETVCTYSYLYDTSGPDSLYTSGCNKKNCSGYLAPYKSGSSSPIFKIEKTDTPYTVKSLGSDHYRYGFRGNYPLFESDGITVSGTNTWIADTNSPLVSPLTSFYVNDGVPLGLPVMEKFAVVWKGQFYARHTGTVTFKFIGNGHYKFDFDGANKKDADIVYDTYQTWTSSSLTSGSFYNFRLEFYTTSREDVGVTAMWKSNASGAFSDYLPISAGVMIRTTDSDFLSSYELPDVIDFKPDYRRGEVDELQFTIPLVKNSNSEGAGYYKDTSTGSYKHASWDSSTETYKYQSADSGYTLSKYDMIEYHEGYRSRSGTDEYVQKFSGHIVDFQPKRESDKSEVIVICRGFGQFLIDSFTENNPTREDYWIAEYGDQSNSETTPEGIKAPIAWDGWELRRFFITALIHAGIDPVLFDRKCQAFDKDYTVTDGEDWEVSDPSLSVYLDKNIHYGNPSAIGLADGTSEDTTIDEEYVFKYNYGTKWIDVVDDVTGQYLYDWGFRGEGYPWLRGNLIPTNIAYAGDISCSGTGW